MQHKQQQPKQTRQRRNAEAGHEKGRFVGVNFKGQYKIHLSPGIVIHCDPQPRLERWLVYRSNRPRLFRIATSQQVIDLLNQAVGQFPISVLNLIDGYTFKA